MCEALYTDCSAENIELEAALYTHNGILEEKLRTIVDQYLGDDGRCQMYKEDTHCRHSGQTSGEGRSRGGTGQIALAI